jgi:hypothetical protein
MREIAPTANQFATLTRDEADDVLSFSPEEEEDGSVKARTMAVSAIWKLKDVAEEVEEGGRGLVSSAVVL